ncbi:MAG TPA: lysophospholipase [Stellaceae bacterium]|nr:lysophospholipase [Stellaceae bacterium]
MRPLLALALLLAACAAPSLPPPDPSDMPTTPHLTEDAIIAEDGARLPLRVWLPAGKVEAVVLAVHGFNDYSNAFTWPAEAWAEHGIATYAYDQRGFGAAPDRRFWLGTERLDMDLDLASRLLREKYPRQPLYLLGESMGAAVIMTAVTGAAGAPRPAADGLILVAPAVWGRATMNVFERVALWAADTLVPGMTLTGRGLGIKPSDNTEMLRALARDPLVIKATRVATIKGLVDLMGQAFAAAPRLDMPMLLLYGEHDEIIPAEPVRRMIEALPPAPAEERRIAWYPQGWHMLLRDLDRAVVTGDIAHWIADRAAPLPSGADRRVSAFPAASRQAPRRFTQK